MNQSLLNQIAADRALFFVLRSYFRSLLFDGQVDGEGAAPARLALDGDAALVRFYYVLDQREAEAAAPRFVYQPGADAVELFKDLPLLFAAQSYAVVMNGYGDEAGRARKLD